jgi:uncharacterized protein
MREPGLEGMGLGCRTPLKSLIIAEADAGRLRFCEVHLRAATKDAATADLLETLASCGIPVVLHSTELNLLSADEPCIATLREGIASLDIVPTMLSGHLASGFAAVPHGEAFVRPPYSRSLLAEVRDRLARLCDALQLPVAVENVALYGDYPQDEIDEISFLRALIESEPASVVFDISNFVANHRNHRSADAEPAALGAAPAYYHVSGGISHEGIYFDTHTNGIDNEMMDALEALVERFPAAILYERDARFEAAAEIGRDVARIHALTLKCSAIAKQ